VREEGREGRKGRGEWRDENEERCEGKGKEARKEGWKVK
jgi:hypothetical protein